VAHGTAPRWPSTAPHGDGEAAGVAPADPLAWFEAERVALVTAVAQAANRGMEELAWDLANLLLGFLSVRNHLDDWRWTHDVALAAAERGGDRRGQAYMLRGLASSPSNVTTFRRPAPALSRPWPCSTSSMTATAGPTRCSLVAMWTGCVAIPSWHLIASSVRWRP
jgi:hypothetical protein